MSLASLAEIGVKALRLQEAVDKRRAARANLRSAYSAFRSRYNAGDYIAKGTERYEMMMEDTSAQYALLGAAERAEQSARRSLETVCKRAQKEIQAGAQAEAAVRRIMEKAA